MIYRHRIQTTFYILELKILSPVFVVHLSQASKRTSFQVHVYNNTDLEERVAILEESVADLELGLTVVAGEVADVENGVGNLENDVTNLEESQNTQDERFLTVEAEVEDLENQVLGTDRINIVFLFLATDSHLFPCVFRQYYALLFSFLSFFCVRRDQVVQN